MPDFNLQYECDPIVMRSLKALIKYSMYTTKHIASISASMVQSILRGIQESKIFTVRDMFNTVLALDSFSKRLVDTLVFLVYGESFANVYKDVKTTINRNQVNKVLWATSSIDKKDIELLHKLNVNTDLKRSRKSITVYLRSDRKVSTRYGCKYKASLVKEKESKFSLKLEGTYYYTDGNIVVLDKVNKEDLLCL